MCERLGVPHPILTASGTRSRRPRSRSAHGPMRYRLLGEWARERGLDRASHCPSCRRSGRDLPDAPCARRRRQGSGRHAPPSVGPPGATSRLVRPLLGWRHSELEAVCVAAGVEPVARSEQRGRTVRASARPKGARRRGLARRRRNRAKAPSHLAEADGALNWATRRRMAARRQAERRRDRLQADRCAARDPPPDHPPRDPGARDRRRRRRAARPRDRPDPGSASRRAARATLRGVLCIGGPDWHFSGAPGAPSGKAAQPR